jgi:hypothetical protein
VPNLKTVTPLLLTTTAMLLIGLTSCQDDTKRTEQSKTGDRPNQQVDEKADRLENRSDRLEDKAERLELKADQERDAEQQRTDKMDKKTGNTDNKRMDEIDIEDEFDGNR